jgi:diguanylate cyclase (GGDEF)-like protein/PAS domain S-box-containing protein
VATILIVDDRIENREYLVTLLGYHRHRLLEASDGAQALAIARAEHPDLIISDILMPTMDGYEFVRRLRADAALAATAVMFLTAHYHTPEAEKLAKDCGVAHILTKPAEPETVLRTVSAALGQQGISPAPPPADFDREHLRILTDKLSEQVNAARRMNERFVALNNVNLNLASEREPARLLDSVCHAARELTAAKYALLAVDGNGETGGSQFTTSGLEPPTVARIKHPEWSEGSVRTALSEAKPLRITNPGGLPSAVGLPALHLPVHSLLAAPIVSLTRNYGWIALVDKLGAREFSAGDELLVAALGAQLGRFYENGSLLRELRASEKRYRTIFENSVVGIFAVDARERIVSISPALLRMLGYEVVDAATVDTDRVAREVYVDPGAQKRFRELLLAEKIVRNFEAAWRRKDGSIISVSLSAKMVGEAGDTDLSHIGLVEDITETVTLRNAVREREAGLRRAQHMAKLAHVITRPDGSFESWSESLPQLLGIEPSRMPGNTRGWLDLLHPEDRQKFRDTAIQAGVEGARKELEYRLRGAQAEWIHVWQVLEPIQGSADPEGRMRWFNTLQDVTEQKQAETRIRRLNRVYAVLSGINTTIVRVRNRDELFREVCRIAIDEGQFRLAWIGMANREAKRLDVLAWKGDGEDYVDRMPLGLDESEAERFGLPGHAVSEGKPIISDDMSHDPRVLLADEAARRGFRSIAVLPIRIGGEVAGVLALYAEETAFFDADEMKLLLELAGDISFALDNIAKEEKLEYLALYDPLTDLPNRNLFRERINQRVGAGSHDAQRLAVALLDIERFNTVNETLGRQTGDELLKQIALRCRRSAADPALVARLVGDQFGLLIPDVGSEDNAARMLQQWSRDVLGSPYLVSEHELMVSTKFGIAIFPDDGADADALLKNAEAALMRAKATGERYLFYNQRMSERVAGQLTLENKLRHALKRNEFVLHYQPKVDVETRRILGVEALMRWQTADLGLVPPGRFIPLLEETGMIIEVGAWALREAAVTQQQWRERKLLAPRVAVNVSGIQLQRRDFVEVVKEALRAGASPAAVDIEITESMLTGDIAAAIEKLKAIRDLGVNIAIDDFGTGYSSLGYLAKLPVHSLKIDRSFTMTMVERPDTMTLVSTIISLAHSLQLKVVAEGVETEEQAKVLRLLRCDELQGYLISRPVPLEQLTPLLAAEAA